MNRLLGTQEDSDFYQVMRVLDSIQQSDDQVVELKLGGHVTFGFQSNLMHKLSVESDGATGFTYEIELNDYHLASPKSVLPDTFVDSIQVSALGGNSAPKAFLDIFNRELISSAYEIRKDLDPSLFNLTPSDDSYFLSLDSLSGLYGRPELRSSLVDLFGDSFEFQSNSFSYRRIGKNYLSDSLEDFLGTTVDVKPFAGAWLPIPDEFQLRLTSDVKLDENVSLGSSHWCYDAAIEIFVDCASEEFFRSLLPGGNRYISFVRALAIISDCNFGIYVQLNLNAEKVPNCVLGESRLGFDAWLLGETQTGEYNFPSYFLSIEELSGAIKGRGDTDVGY
ncbi:MAG: type VI secretion system baseplate subunit TssG [Betaproteobacteria bacterium]